MSSEVRWVIDDFEQRCEASLSERYDHLLWFRQGRPAPLQSSTAVAALPNQTTFTLPTRNSTRNSQHQNLYSHSVS
jgi:hypothetical protein